MDKLLFRCHSVGALLSEPKSKAARDNNELGETAKSLVRNMWLHNNFDYKERVYTDAMMKGNLCEADSMKLVSQVLGNEYRAMSKKTLSNDYIVGTPDIILTKEDCVEDIKTSENLRTFLDAEPTKIYEAQAQCYMELADKSNFRLIYCLVKTPESIIANDKKKVYYKFDCDEENPDYIAASMQIEHNNNIIESIPKEKRIKVFEFKRDKAFIENLYKKIDAARLYYNTLSL